MGKQYFLSKAAEADLENIIIYTLNEWGQEQVLKYKRQLESRLDAIIAFPDMGKKHPKLPSSIYYIVEGAHYIFYKKSNDDIDILRILHHRMNILTQITGEL